MIWSTKASQSEMAIFFFYVIVEFFYAEKVLEFWKLNGYFEIINWVRKILVVIYS